MDRAADVEMLGSGLDRHHRHAELDAVDAEPEQLGERAAGLATNLCLRVFEPGGTCVRHRDSVSVSRHRRESLAGRSPAKVRSGCGNDLAGGSVGGPAADDVAHREDPRDLGAVEHDDVTEAAPDHRAGRLLQ